jgi:hypothetical protein
MSEPLTVPRFRIGNRQVSPDATLMSLVEFSPQSASSANVEQSEAARAGDTDAEDIEPTAPTISAKAVNSDNRIVGFLVSMQTRPTKVFSDGHDWSYVVPGFLSLRSVYLSVVGSPRLMQIK